MRRRHITAVAIVLMGAIVWLMMSRPDMTSVHTSEEVSASAPEIEPDVHHSDAASNALTALDTLQVKGKAPKTGYARTQFGNGWASSGGCDTRNRILQRDLTSIQNPDGCIVLRGVLDDPYTGKQIIFARGVNTSGAVQIDHAVALAAAWVTGAQQLTVDERRAMANDPLELLAVDGVANMQKSDGDAATWLPPNKAFRCQYVARQIAVKVKYRLYVTAPEKKAMQHVLATCPQQMLPGS